MLNNIRPGEIIFPHQLFLQIFLRIQWNFIKLFHDINIFIMRNPHIKTRC